MTDEKQNFDDRISWWNRMFGRRSILKALFGNFFSDKNNAASIISIMLVSSLCYLLVFKEKYEYMDGFFNIIFVVIGYYFGSKQKVVGNDDDTAN